MGKTRREKKRQNEIARCEFSHPQPGSTWLAFHTGQDSEAQARAGEGVGWYAAPALLFAPAL